MVKSLDILALFEGHIAAGADLIAGVAGLGAGRVLGVNELGIVAESGNGLLSGEDLLADRADSALGHAGLGAGGSLCLNVNGGVIDHLGLLAGLHDLAAELADDIAGVAFLCAGCFLDVCELVGCDVLGLLSGNIVFNAVSIAERLIVVYKLILVALGALLDRDAGMVAGCGNELGLFILVAGSSYNLILGACISNDLTANAAYLLFCIDASIFSTGRVHNVCCARSMIFSLNHAIGAFYFFISVIPLFSDISVFILRVYSFVGTILSACSGLCRNSPGI